jgi:serine protease AprX
MNGDQSMLLPAASPNEGRKREIFMPRTPLPRLRTVPLLGALALTLALAFASPAAAAAPEGRPAASRAHVPASLLAAAREHPSRTFRVIVQGPRAREDVAAAIERHPARAARVRHTFTSIDGLAAELTGEQLQALAASARVRAITRDGAVRLAGSLNKQKWPRIAGVHKFWHGKMSENAVPAIAIVDSGIEAGRADFGNRVVADVTLSELEPNSGGDGRGHGTFVASIAAGSAEGYTGAAPRAKLVSIDVVDDRGMAMTSDVIRAADWILANKDAYGIRVANFSLFGSVETTFRFDPLDRAVERLWFSGIVVVAAAGNHGAEGQPVGVPYAPGNDPFIITVGANDTGRSVSTQDDRVAPWSAYGSTPDGFQKPELVAPGRFLVAAVPASSTLASERPDKVVEPGYMQLSGTSFAAPVVAGAAANLLAAHPDWSPDQVKGALMLTTRAMPNAVPGSAGVGEVNAGKAVRVDDPPNPNAALNEFIVPDPEGGAVPVFDAASWTNAAKSNEAWDAASWTSASWTSASWTNASWTSASWTSASWTSASWTSASWTSASWTSASWTSASWTSASWTSAIWEDRQDGADRDAGYWIEDPKELEEAEDDE